MADDLNMTPLLPSLTATAQIRRVKPTDPENERRSSEEQSHRRKKSKEGESSPRATAAVEVDIQNTVTPEEVDRATVADQNQIEAESEPNRPDKTIDIRV
jgi:DNA polymerase III gamma/tau subunit